MITIKLYGIFKELAGSIHRVHNINSFKLVFKYCLSIPKLRKFLVNNRQEAVHIFLNGTQVTFKDLDKIILVEGDTVCILPKTFGSGDSWQTIVGVILIIVGAILMYFGDYGGTVFNLGYMMLAAGASLVVSGMQQGIIAQSGSYDDLFEKKLTSYGFQGAALNQTRQGNPVPIGYGRMLVGSQVIGQGLFSVNL